MYLQEELETILEAVLFDHGLPDAHVSIQKYDMPEDLEAPILDEAGEDCFQVVVWTDGSTPESMKKLSLIFPAPTAQQAQDPEFIQALMEGAGQTLQWMAKMKLRQGGAD